MPPRGEAMPTLHIENVPEDLYRELSARAERDSRTVGEEALLVLGELVERPATHSLLELRGLGKEVWEGVDPAAHVDEERGSWR